MTSKLADKVNDAKVKYKNALKAWEDATKAGAADIATKKSAANEARLELDAANLLASKDLAGPQSDRTGVMTGVGPASVSSTPGGGGASIDFLAYQFNLVMPWKANCGVKKGPDGKDDPADAKRNKGAKLLMFTGSAECDKSDTLSNYRFVPVYFLLHKTVRSQINSDTLSHDLLDNEHGGLVNIKFTPLIYDFTADDVNAEGKKDLIHGSKVAILDFGVKYVEAPSVDPKSQKYVGAGYFGVGYSIELPMYHRQDTLQDIVAGAKPAGTLALGLGIYRNTVNSGGFDNSGLSTPVPRFYGTRVLNYEFQVTNVISIFGSRTVPTSRNSLGTYTSVAVKYNFK